MYRRYHNVNPNTWCSMEAVAIILCFMLPVTLAGFTIRPLPMVVGLGEEAVFQCQYPGASISWRINGSTDIIGTGGSVSTSPGGQASDTLTIIALPDYNATVVVCVALLSNYSIQQSVPVQLIIYVSTITQLPMTTAAADDGFIISPEDRIVPEELSALFICQHKDYGIIWRVNGESVNGNATHVPRILANFTHTLNIKAKPDFNGTVVDCEAVDHHHKRSAKRTVQGLPKLSSELRTLCRLNSSCTVSWEEAISLDLTDIEPDVEYTVEIYRLSSPCVAGVMILSERVFQPFYEFAKPDSPYELVVTPRSNAEGAMNGTRNSTRADYIKFDINSTNVKMSDLKENVAVELEHIPKIHTSNMTEVTPASFSISLESVDDAEKIVLRNCTCEQDNKRGVLKVNHLLQSQRLWVYHLYANNCSGSTLSDNMTLSTHYVQNITARETSVLGRISICGDYVADSSARGFLVIANGSSGVHYGVAHRGSLHTSSSCTTLSGLSGTSYSYSVFTVDEMGIPITRSADLSKQCNLKPGAIYKEPEVDDDTTHAEAMQTPHCSGVFIRCKFNNESTDSCVAVVHKEVDGLMSIIVELLIRVDKHVASGCVQNVSLQENYFVVFGYSTNRNMITSKAVYVRKADSTDSTLNSPLMPAVISVVVVVVLAVIALALMIFLTISLHKKKKKLQSLLETGHESSVNRYMNTQHPSYQRIATDGDYATVRQVQPSSSSLPNVTEDANSVEDNYSKPDIITPFFSVPSTADPVMYSAIKGTKGVNGDIYTEVKTPKSVSEDKPDDLTKVVYSDIQQQLQGVPRPLLAQSKTEHSRPSPTPFSLENIVSELSSIAPKWQTIGEALSLSEKRLDDISTTEQDEVCLQQMVEVYMMNCGCDHTWDELVLVLRNIGEDGVAEKVYQHHIAPFVVSLPNQPQLGNASPITVPYTSVSTSAHVKVATDADDGLGDSSSSHVENEEDDKTNTEDHDEIVVSLPNLVSECDPDSLSPLQGKELPDAEKPSPVTIKTNPCNSIKAQNQALTTSEVPAAKIDDDCGYVSAPILCDSRSISASVEVATDGDDGLDDSSSSHIENEEDAETNAIDGDEGKFPMATNCKNAHGESNLGGSRRTDIVLSGSTEQLSCNEVASLCKQMENLHNNLELTTIEDLSPCSSEIRSGYSIVSDELVGSTKPAVLSTVSECDQESYFHILASQLKKTVKDALQSPGKHFSALVNYISVHKKDLFTLTHPYKEEATALSFADESYSDSMSTEPNNVASVPAGHTYAESCATEICQPVCTVQQKVSLLNKSEKDVYPECQVNKKKLKPEATVPSIDDAQKETVKKHVENEHRSAKALPPLCFWLNPLMEVATIATGCLSKLNPFMKVATIATGCLSKFQHAFVEQMNASGLKCNERKAKPKKRVATLCGCSPKKKPMKHVQGIYDVSEWLFTCLGLYNFMSLLEQFLMLVQKNVRLSKLEWWRVACVLLLLQGVPSSGDIVIADKVQAQGANVTFSCLYNESGLVSIGWTINNESEPFQSFKADMIHYAGGSNLTLEAPSGYHFVIVNCSVTVNRADTWTISAVATLTIQEPLQRVMNLRVTCDEDSLNVEWDPPKSLNLTVNRPNIQYTVLVFRSDKQLVLNHTTTSTMFTFNVTEFDSQYMYHFTVTPRSYVEGAVLGETSEAISVLCTLSVENIDVDVEKSVMVVYLGEVHNDEHLTTLHFNATVLDNSESVVQTCKLAINESSDEGSISLNTERCAFAYYRHLTVDVNVYSRHGNFTIASGFNLNTYGISSIRVDNASQRGEVTISAQKKVFTEGFLVVLCNETNSCFSKVALQQPNLMHSNISVDISLNNGKYHLTVYTLKLKSGFPPRGAPAFSTELFISGSLTSDSLPANPTIEPNSKCCDKGAFIKCSFPDNSVDACAVLVFNKTGFEFIRSIIINRTGADGSKCTDIDFDSSKIVVYAYDRKRGTLLNSPIKYNRSADCASYSHIAPIVLILLLVLVAVVLLLVLVAVVVTLLQQRRKKKLRHPETGQSLHSTPQENNNVLQSSDEQSPLLSQTKSPSRSTPPSTGSGDITTSISENTTLEEQADGEQSLVGESRVQKQTDFMDDQALEMQPILNSEEHSTSNVHSLPSSHKQQDKHHPTDFTEVETCYMFVKQSLPMSEADANVFNDGKSPLTSKQVQIEVDTTNSAHPRTEELPVDGATSSIQKPLANDQISQESGNSGVDQMITEEGSVEGKVILEPTVQEQPAVKEKLAIQEQPVVREAMSQTLLEFGDQQAFKEETHEQQELEEDPAIEQSTTASTNILSSTQNGGTDSTQLHTDVVKESFLISEYQVEQSQSETNTNALTNGKSPQTSEQQQIKVDPANSTHSETNEIREADPSKFVTISNTDSDSTTALISASQQPDNGKVHQTTTKEDSLEGKVIMDNQGRTHHRSSSFSNRELNHKSRHRRFSLSIRESGSYGTQGEVVASSKDSTLSHCFGQDGTNALYKMPKPSTARPDGLSNVTGEISIPQDFKEFHNHDLTDQDNAESHDKIPLSDDVSGNPELTTTRNTGQVEKI